MKSSASEREAWALRSQIKQLKQEKKELIEALKASVFVNESSFTVGKKPLIDFAKSVLKQHTS